MRSLRIALFFLSYHPFAMAIGSDSVTCEMSGRNPHGIIRVTAFEIDHKLYSRIQIRNPKGEIQGLDAYQTEGSLETEFQVAPYFDRGYFGIKSAHLVKRGQGYVLESRTYCDFGYQEESCGAEQILDRQVEEGLVCKSL